MITRVLCSIILFTCAALSLTAKDVIRVHMLSGSEEYQSEGSLKGWAAHLHEAYGIESTFSFGTDKSQSVDGLEQLAEADALIVFCRRWKLSSEQAKLIRHYIDKGQPVVGIRTASHAFEFYKDFDHKILGGDYSGHGKGEQMVPIQHVFSQEAHPIMKEVDAWERLGKPYRNPAIASDAIVLLTTDTEELSAPLAWARTVEDGQRIFYTSLGIPTDFENASFVRLLDNALFWVMQTETVR